MGNLDREEQEYASQSGSNQQPGEESSTRHGSKWEMGRWGNRKEVGVGEWLEQWRFSVVIGFQFYLLILHQFFDSDDFLGNL